MTLMWIALGLLAWVAVPLPLAVLVGRVFGRGATPVAIPPALRGTGTGTDATTGADSSLV